MIIPGTAWSAHSADTFLIGQTFTGSRASGRWVTACHFGIAYQSFHTSALSPVVDSLAFGIGTASGGRGANGYTLGVETGVCRRTIGICSASRFTATHRAYLAAGTVGVLSTDGHAHSLTAAFVDQALGIGRAEWTTYRVLTSESGGATLRASTRCRFSDASRIGCRIS